MNLLIHAFNLKWFRKAARVYDAAIRQASPAPRRPHKRMSQPAFQPESHPQNPHLHEVQLQEIQATEIQTPEEKAEESRRIRRLQLMMNMVMQVIQQDRSLPVEEASEMVADVRRAALAMFPDKALAFDLIFWPRLQRLMRERYRMQ
jgi:hypothetical protein